jgi:hypothetical protein
MFFMPPRGNAAFVNMARQSVTLTWIESEGDCVHMTASRNWFLPRTWRMTMKALTKIAAASILTLSVVAPAFAGGEEGTPLERNTYATQHAAQPVRHSRVQSHRASDAFAYAPAGGAAYGYSTQDFGIGSQR